MLLALAVGLASVSLGSQTPPPGEWRAWGADKASTKYAPLDQINTDTINDLTVVWRQSATPAEISARASVRSPSRNYQNTPLMAGGLIYVSTGIGTTKPSFNPLPATRTVTCVLVTLYGTCTVQLTAARPLGESVIV